jgi:hypothetical protein
LGAFPAAPETQALRSSALTRSGPGYAVAARPCGAAPLQSLAHFDAPLRGERVTMPAPTHPSGASGLQWSADYADCAINGDTVDTHHDEQNPRNQRNLWTHNARPCGPTVPGLADPGGRDLLAPGGRDLLAPGGRDLLAPRGRDLVAPRGLGLLGPVGQDLLGPVRQDLLGPVRQDLLGPGGQDLLGPGGQGYLAQGVFSSRNETLVPCRQMEESAPPHITFVRLFPVLEQAQIQKTLINFIWAGPLPTEGSALGVEARIRCVVTSGAGVCPRRKVLSAM